MGIWLFDGNVKAPETKTWVDLVTPTPVVVALSTSAEEEKDASSSEIRAASSGNGETSGAFEMEAASGKASFQLLCLVLLFPSAASHLADSAWTIYSLQFHSHKPRFPPCPATPQYSYLYSALPYNY